MPINIFGLVSEGLTNPLTENLDANGFEIQDIDKIFTNEIHDNGEGNITVHEPLHLQNNRLTHMGDPVASTDGVNLSYAETNFASASAIPTTAPYDIFSAFGDETTPISLGIQPVVLPVPRNFTMTSVRCYLTNPATTTNYPLVDVRLNGTVITGSQGICVFPNPGDTTSTLGTFSPSIFLGVSNRLTVAMNSDATASGLKIVFNGFVSI